MDIVGVMVSVKYDDYLRLIIKHNKSILNFVVVTTSTDIATQNLCKEHGVHCIISDSCYDGGCRFNTSKMINVGLRYVYEHFPNHAYVVLNSDIYLANGLCELLDTISQDDIYFCERYIIEDMEFRDFDSVIETPEKFNFRKESCPSNGIYVGFLQLFTNKLFYNESYDNASECDLEFADRYKNRKCLNGYSVVHIGTPGINWFGRKSKRWEE